FVLNAAGSNFGSLFLNLKPYPLRRQPATKIETETGEVFIGELAKETADELELRLPNASSKVIAVREIKERSPFALSSESIANRLREEFAKKIDGAMVAVFGPPPVRGVGRAGGFTIMIEDRGDFGPQELQKQTDNLVRL